MSDRGRARSNSRDRNDRGDSRGDSRADRSDRDDKVSSRDGPEATTSLLVRNLSYRVRADEIRRIFVRYGDIRDVYIPQVITTHPLVSFFIRKCLNQVHQQLSPIRIITHKDLEDSPSLSFTTVGTPLMHWTTLIGTRWTAEKLPLCLPRIVVKLLTK